MSKKKRITEYRVCWKDWQRDSQGHKVETTIRCTAYDRKQAEQFLNDDPERNWIETRKVTEWKPL